MRAAILPALALLLAACGPAEPVATPEETAACCECLAEHKSSSLTALLVEQEDGTWAVDRDTAGDVELCVEHLNEGETLADVMWWSAGEAERYGRDPNCVAECSSHTEALALATYRHCVSDPLVPAERCEQTRGCFAAGISLDECQ